MRKLFLFSIVALLGALVLFQCKKKDDSPAPASTTSSTGTTSTTGSTGTTSTTSTTSTQPANSLTFQSVTSTLIPSTQTTSNGQYNIIGNNSSSSGHPALTIAFTNGKPTTSQTINLNVTGPVIAEIITASYTVLTASSGTAYVTVNGSNVTCTFSNATFTDLSTNTTYNASGSITGN